MIYCSELGNGSTNKAGNTVIRGTQCIVISPCGKMPRDKICMYREHVCFYVCCRDCVRVCGMFVV